MRSSVRDSAKAVKARFDVSPAVTVVSPRMGEQGWPFASVDKFPEADVDPLYDSKHVKDLYLRADPEYSGRSVCFTSKTVYLLTIFVADSPSLSYGTRRIRPS